MQEDKDVSESNSNTIKSAPALPPRFKERGPNNFPNFPVNSISKQLIKINRKGLTSIHLEELKRLLALPDNLMLGTAVDDGGCFFDGLAQTLNVIQNTDKYSEKFLRKACHEFYYAHKKEVSEWNTKDYGGIDKGDDYGFIQYTKEELDNDFNGRTPIWGRQHIEGIMLCRVLNLSAIHVIELLVNPENGQPILAHSLITKNGVNQTEGGDIPPYTENIPVLILGQKDLHFIPILPKIENSNSSEYSPKAQEVEKVTGKDDEIINISLKIEFSSLEIEYNPQNLNEEVYIKLKNMVKKYNSAISCLEELVEANPSEISKIENLILTMLNCFNKIETYDSIWFKANGNHVYNVVNAGREIYNKIMNRKNDELEKLYFDLKPTYEKSKNDISGEDKKREELRKSDYLRYVTEELGHATYDNISSLINTVSHPYATLCNTASNMKLILWDVGPRKSFPAILGQMYERPWYYGFSIAESYAFNYGIKKVDQTFGISQTIDQKLGISDKIESFKKASDGLATSSKSLNEAIEKISKNLNSIESTIKNTIDKIQDLTISTQLKASLENPLWSKFKKLISSLGSKDSNSPALETSLNESKKHLDLLNKIKELLNSNLELLESSEKANEEAIKTLCDNIKNYQENIKIIKKSVKSVASATAGINTTSNSANLIGKFGFSLWQSANSPYIANIYTATAFTKLLQSSYSYGENLNSNSKHHNPM